MFTNRNKYQNQLFFMKLALEQAKKSLGNTKKNPAVGCIITKNNQIISAGSTGYNGTPHAEINALNFSKINSQNCNLYVTLEPCSHYGKTPPCVKYIIKKKIKKVFFSIKDPDLRSFDKSKNLFNKERISTNVGLLKKEVEIFYRSYLKSKSDNLPFVTSKIALSKDFYTINKNKKWITNIYSRGRVHLLRSYHDCIITSSKTIMYDNPRFTCRIEGLKDKSPSRIILDRKLKIKIKSKIIKEAKYYPTIIFYNETKKRKINLLKKFKIKFYKIPLDKDGNLNLKSSLIKAKELGFSRIFLESGIKLTTSFLAKNLIDDFIMMISNHKLGKNGGGNIKNYLNKFLRGKRKKIEKVNLFGEKLLSYKLK